MAIDPRQLRPAELCRLLNSTPLGEVINERQLYRHRTRAGFRIGDGRHVDLLRYAAWLVHVRHEPKPPQQGDPYATLKERARARNVQLSLAGRDIGELPNVADPERRRQAAADFRFCCEAYFPQTFHLPWSPDHLKVIAKIEEAVLHGGLFAMAMPRGSGKTTICECACIWAVLNGHREFVCLIGSDEGHAMDMLESIKTGDDDLLTADAVARKTNGLGRREVPVGCNHLTMFVDVQQKLLFFVVAAWETDFTGYVIEYGAYPDQKRAYFTLRDARKTLTTAAGGAGLEGSIYAGLEALTAEYLDREWRRDDGAAMRIERCLVDANWGSSTDVVYQFCRQSRHAAVLMPSHGRFVGASSVPFSEYKRKPGDRVGLNWRVPNVRGKRAVRHVVFDTNFWKSFVHARLAVTMGDRGCLSLFGRDAETHRLFAEHLTAEYRVKTEGRGRTVDEWKARPEQPDNHWLDCLVGSAVSASIQGVALLGPTGTPALARRRIKLSELRESRTRPGGGRG